MEPLAGSRLKPLIIDKGAVLRLQVDNVCFGEFRIEVDHRMLARDRDVVHVHNQVWISADHRLPMHQLDPLPRLHVLDHELRLKHQILNGGLLVLHRQPGLGHQYLTISFAPECRLLCCMLSLLL